MHTYILLQLILIRLMNIYPLKQINRDLWEKKVNSTSMFTIPAEDEALPVLHELDQILTRLMTLPIQETLSQALIPYFFTGVFPPVCQKIIRSRYFKNSQVLKISNNILEKSLYLVPKYIDLAIKNPKFFEILITIFADQPYFKTNNQLNYMIYPYSYFPPNNKQMVVKIGELVDVIKIGNLYQKVTWSQGQIFSIDQEEYQVKYLYDQNDKKTIIRKNSHQIAPLNSKSVTFQWRKSLKKGDLVDVEDSFGSWYNGTVLQVIQKQDGKKNVKITLKVYDQNGNRQDQNGSFFGFLQKQQTFDFTSPKIAPFCTVAKKFCYQSTKISSYDSVEDMNDYQFSEINGTKIYAFPRKKNLSEFHFHAINGFGQLGGFDKILSYLQSQINFQILASFAKGISGITPYLHRELVKKLVERLQILIQRYIFSNQEKTTKFFTKQISQHIFNGIKTLLKRLYMSDIAIKQINAIKMRFVNICLQSQSLKSKLQGLNQLKDIIKTVSYLSDRFKYVKQWIKANNIFDKIYIVNSHVQLIKKSEQFFKYLITQNILQVTDLQKLYRMAQKGDFESRVSIYKLFQQVSYNFKKEHGQFLIDTILDSELHLVLNQDIDLLHQLSRFSNYYPLQKVFVFFQNIILGDNKTKELNDYATKKYSQIVAKNSEAKPFRQEIIKKFISKLQTHDIGKITKILKGIFEGMAIGQSGKKELNEMLCEQKIDQVVIIVLKKSKGLTEFNKNYTFFLDFLLFTYKLSYKIIINISILDQMWELISSNEEKKEEFYRWANQICKCEQGIESTLPEQFQKFYRKIFSPQIIPSLTGTQFELAKNIFVQINRKLKYIAVSNVFKDRDVQKQYNRKTEMNDLKLIDVLLEMVYKIKQEGINNQVLYFFIELYNSKPNTQRQIDQFLNKLLVNFKEEYEAKNYRLLVQTIKLIQVVINGSQKNVETNIKSLISKKQPDYAKFIIINQCSSFLNDSFKKSDLILPMNMPIIRVRKLLGKEFKLNWQEIKIVSNKQISDYENSRTIKQIKLNPNQPLTVSRRIILSETDEDLIINDSMNPKAIRCFKQIFENYSTEGKMDKNQCNGFTAVCLGTSGHVRYDQKITSVYKKYDDDNDGFMTFQNFIKFYQDAAKDRAHTVWSNLKSFGVRGNFKFPHEPDQVYEVEKYPRNVIAEYPKVYQILFDLLHVKQVASVAFQLLERLPVSSTIQEQLLNIQTKEDLQRILDVQDLYKLFYRLNLIEYLAHSTQLQAQVQKTWHKKFIELEGYELLYVCIEKISQSKKEKNQNEEFKEIIREITQTGLILLNEYWIQSFSTDSKKLRTSLAFISYEQEIDDKMDYLLYGRFFKNDKKIESLKSKLPQISTAYTWKGKQKQSIKQFFLQQLQNKWVQVCKIKSNETTQRKYNITMLLFKLFDSINILLMNQNPQSLASITSNLFDQNFSNELIRRFYCLILSLCFYSQNKHQAIFIRQLFRNLTKRTITSEHFRVLSVLVSKFGIQNSGDEGESTQMLTSVLFDNVLNNKNQLTIEGCAKLLTNFYLKGTPYEVFERIWNERLFNPETICQKDQSRSALYSLILKLCDNNPGLIQRMIQKVVQTLKKQTGNMKIANCNEYKQRSGTGYAGLKNLSNTCYINSMIQQLFMNRNFRYCILRADDKESPNLIEVIDNKNQIRTVDDNFLHQVQRIFANLQLTTRVDFAPRDFCVAYKPFGQSVNILIQQDVQQFISMFFDRLEAGLSKTMFKKLVEDFYTGKSVNLFKCHSCSKTKKVEESFYSISLQVKTSKTLAQSFNRFCHGQMINDYKCDFCNNKVDVTKKTRISKSPKTLIIHLQRIVFNLDTFINDKISSKHSFPHNFNLHQSTIDYYERVQAGQTDIEEPKEYNYNLIGIVCHSGTAQSGHYICYVKTYQNKWVEFNDSIVTSFSPSNIQSECFGGSFAMASAYDEQYYDEKKQSSKSAYLLVYEKQGADTVQLIIQNQLQNCKSSKERQQFKQKLLQSLDLKQVIQKLQKNQKNANQNQKKEKGSSTEQNATNIMTEEKQESSSAPEDSEKQTKKLLQAKQLQIKRHQSEDNIQTEIVQLNRENSKEQPQKPTSEQITVRIEEPVNPYIPSELRQQVLSDNITHFMEKCLSSASFVKFFSQLISLPNNFYSQILGLCKKLTFGFWLKSPSFKDLLVMLDDILKRYPQGFEDIVTNNPLIINLLIQSSDSDVRTCMANFLAKVIADTIQTKKININDNNDDPIFKFLDKLFSLLPSTVSKCWTKFGQYFEFWYQLSTRGEVLVEYMVNRQIIKHFMDYFLDTKSPLKIYATKREHQIGSSYASPNFSMLLKCVFSLLHQRMLMRTKKNYKIINSEQQQILLMSHESLQKLINDKYQNIAAQLVKQICPNNLQASEKAAIVLLKGVAKSSSQTVQPYLQVLHQFVLIDDQYQDLRIKWVIGKQTIAVSTMSLKIIAMNSYSLEERIHHFQPTIQIESGISILQLILIYQKRIQTYSMLCTRLLLKLCEANGKIRKLIFSLESPTLISSKYVDFFRGFIDKYVQDQKKSYGFYSSTTSGFNREQFGKEVKILYEKVITKVEEDQKQILVKQQTKQEDTNIEKVRQEDQKEKQTKQNGEQVENKIEKLESSQKQNIVSIEEGEQMQKSSGKEVDSIKYTTSDEVLSENMMETEIPNLKQHSQHVNESEQQIQQPQLKQRKQYKSTKSIKYKQKQTSKDYAETWHPIKFQYKVVKNNHQLAQSFPNFYIEQHESVVTYLLTKPTGTTNKSFTSKGGVQKSSQRLLQQTWNNSKQVTVHGFYAKNYSKQNFRIQTNEGSVQCKGGQNCFIWADSIIRVWIAQKCMDWPKWKLYEKKAKQ